MQRFRNQGFLFVAIGLCAAGVASASESEPVGSAAYRLNLENAGQFRLESKHGNAPPSERPKEPASSAHLAVMPFAAEINRAAWQAALDPALLHALIHVESRHNPSARSPKGALGLMQVMPETAARYGIANPTRSIEANLTAGTRYLRDLMGMFDRRIELVLAAYNAGENAVMRHGQRIPPYRETQQYVPAVLNKYREFQDSAPVLPASPQRIEYLPGTTPNAAPLPQARP